MNIISSHHHHNYPSSDSHSPHNNIHHSSHPLSPSLLSQTHFFPLVPLTCFVPAAFFPGFFSTFPFTFSTVPSTLSLTLGFFFVTVGFGFATRPVAVFFAAGFLVVDVVLVVVLVLRLVVVPVLGLRVGAVLMVGMMRGLELPVAARVEAIVAVGVGSVWCWVGCKSGVDWDGSVLGCG